MRKRTGARFKLGEPWDSDLADFCTAHFDAPATSVIRAALTEYLNRQLAADPEARKRYEEARAKRRAGKDKVTILHPVK